jgi:hypothetical protein
MIALIEVSNRKFLAFLTSYEELFKWAFAGRFSGAKNYPQ